MPDESEDEAEAPPKNVMEALLSIVREQYIEEHGEEPPEGFIRDIRNELVHGIASYDREAHREIYDALADG